MAQNIFTPENMKKYLYSTGSTTNIGEFVDRNGVAAMRLSPAPYYNANYNPQSAYLFADEFKPNTQYIFDLWIDADDVIYQDVNRAAGLYAVYSDGTSNAILHTGTHGSGGTTGFVHKRYITTPGKTLSGVTVYYWTSVPPYYRWDSSITEYTNTSVEKTGVLDTGILKENSDIASLVNGGEITCDRILEI